MKKKTIFQLLAMAFITIWGIVAMMACGPGFPQTHKHLYSTLELIKAYKIGEELTTPIGSSMVFVGHIPVRSAYRPRYIFKPPVPKGFPSRLEGVFEINPSQIWVVVKTTKDDLMLNIDLPGELDLFSLDINMDGTVPEKPWRKSQSSNSLIIPDQKEWNLPDKKLFEKTQSIPDETIKLSGFKAELLYNGISKNTIKITYREFVEDLARPAFFQELNYDLDQSKLIQFKSLKIKILSADNSAIKFIVLDDGGLPWIPKR